MLGGGGGGGGGRVVCLIIVSLQFLSFENLTLNFEFQSCRKV